MRICERFILIDPDGSFMLNAIRTAIGLTLGILVDQFGPFDEWGIYSVLMGVFSVQIVMGNCLSRNILSVLVNTMLIGIAVMLGSLCILPLQMVMISLLAALTMYLFSCRPAVAMVSLFVTLFGIIANGLALEKQPVMTHVIPALMAGGACALVAFLLLPARTSRLFRRHLPSVILHRLGETCRWFASLPAVRDFNQLSTELKKATFNHQAALLRLLNVYNAGGGSAVPSSYSVMLIELVESVITLSYWPAELLEHDELTQVNELRQHCFLELADLLCTFELLSYNNRRQRLTMLHRWLFTALPEGSSPSLRLLVSLLLGLVEKCLPLTLPEHQRIYSVD